MAILEFVSIRTMSTVYMHVLYSTAMGPEINQFSSFIMVTILKLKDRFFRYARQQRQTANSSLTGLASLSEREEKTTENDVTPRGKPINQIAKGLL